MKILFIGRSTYHFTYYESLINSLCIGGHEIEVIFDKQWSNNQSSQALDNFQRLGYENFKWRYFNWHPGKLRKCLLGIRELRSYSSYLRRHDQSEFYMNRWWSYLPNSIRPVVVTRWVQSALASRIFENLFAFLESIYPADKRALECIRSVNPDLLLVSPGNMRFGNEIDYVKAANFIGVPSVALVLSWDNLTTKGLFHVHPELLLCWNATHANEAITIHNISSDRVQQIGSLFFDKWFDIGSSKITRDAFCTRIGLDSTRPFFLYLGSSRNIAADETWVVEQIWNAMRNHPDPKVATAQILVRPHPANAKNYLRLGDLEGLVTWPKEGSLPESEESQVDFLNSILHSEAAMGINTSGMIDSIVLGRPCIAILVDRYKKTQDQATHFRHLFCSGAMNIAKGVKGCVPAMANLLSGNDTTFTRRKHFIETFVRPYGSTLTAGELGTLALEILNRQRKWDHLAKSIFEISIKNR